MAARYLSKNGFKVLSRNFRCKGGEIDIIATRAGELHFVEVKLRGNSRFGLAAESVLPWKQKRLTRAAKFYLMRNKKWGASPHCFSVVAIEGDSHVELFVNAFEPQGELY